MNADGQAKAAYSDTTVKVEDETLTRKRSKVNFKEDETQTELEATAVVEKPRIPILVVTDDEEKPKKSNLKQPSHNEEPMLPRLHRIARKKVEVVFEFHNIGKIDTMNEKFQAEVTILCKWKMPSGYKHADEEYDAEKHWNPKLYVENAVSVIQDVSYEATEEDGHYFITESRNVRGTFWSNMQLRNVSDEFSEELIRVKFNELIWFSFNL